MVKLKKVIKRNLPYKSIESPIMIAGPCSVESLEVMCEIAEFLKRLGVDYLRGGAFKPRTSPYSFQGLGLEGLDILRYIKKHYGLKIVSELLDVRDTEEVCQVADVIQIGSRNMYNYTLLREIGKTNKTVLLKRGLCATIEEWLGAAEYIAIEGNSNIILCERGIRTFETETRNTLDLNSIPIIKRKTGLRVIADASHGTGIREIVTPMSMAAIACGADGLLTEIHPRPDDALSDGFQSLNFSQYNHLYNQAKGLFNYIKQQPEQNE